RPRRHLRNVHADKHTSPFAVHTAAMLESQRRQRPVQNEPPRKGRVVAEGNTPAPDGAAGIREDPVTGIARKDSSMVVSVAGELDLYNAHALREALLECCNEAPERLVVDLSNVKFIDSTA